MELLENIQNELSRLYIGGSKNAVGDIRLKKYIDSCDKFAEKSKVFGMISSGLTTLINGTEEESYTNLSKVYTLVNSIDITMHRFDTTDDINEIDYTTQDTYNNVLSTVEFNGFLENKFDDEQALLYAKDSRLFIKLPQLLKSVSPNSNIWRDLMERVLPNIGEDLAFQLLDNFEEYQKAIQNKIVMLVFNKLGEKSMPKFLEIIEKEGKKVNPLLIEYLGVSKEYEELALSYANERKKVLSSAGLVALYIMKSDKANELIYNKIESGDVEAVDRILMYSLGDLDDGIVDAFASKMLDELNEFLNDNDRKLTYEIEGEFNRIASCLAPYKTPKVQQFFQAYLSTEIHTNSNESTVYTIIRNDKLNSIYFNCMKTHYLNVKVGNTPLKNMDKFHNRLLTSGFDKYVTSAKLLFNNNVVDEVMSAYNVVKNYSNPDFLKGYYVNLHGYAKGIERVKIAFHIEEETVYSVVARNNDDIVEITKKDFFTNNSEFDEKVLNVVFNDKHARYVTDDYIMYVRAVYDDCKVNPKLEKKFRKEFLKNMGSFEYYNAAHRLGEIERLLTYFNYSDVEQTILDYLIDNYNTFIKQTSVVYTRRGTKNLILNYLNENEDKYKKLLTKRKYAKFYDELMKEER